MTSDLHTQPSPAQPLAADARRYVAAWASLLLLTASSFGVDHLGVGRLTLPVTLVIAAVKALLVLWFFMHLRAAPFSVRLIATLTAGWVVIICIGIAADVAAR